MDFVCSGGEKLESINYKFDQLSDFVKIGRIKG